MPAVAAARRVVPPSLRSPRVPSVVYETSTRYLAMRTSRGRTLSHPPHPHQSISPQSAICNLTSLQLPRHLHHRPPEPEPAEERLRRLVLLRRPQDHARHAASLEPPR